MRRAISYDHPKKSERSKLKLVHMRVQTIGVCTISRRVRRIAIRTRKGGNRNRSDDICKGGVRPVDAVRRNVVI